MPVVAGESPDSTEKIVRVQNFEPIQTVSSGVNGLLRLAFGWLAMTARLTILAVAVGSPDPTQKRDYSM